MDLLIIGLIFLGILVILFFAAIGAVINGEKGLSTTREMIIGRALPFIGVMVLALQKQSTKNVVDEMYDRGLIKKEEHDKTMEILIEDIELKANKK